MTAQNGEIAAAVVGRDEAPAGRASEPGPINTAHKTASEQHDGAGKGPKPPGDRTSALLSDPTVHAVNTAFRLGWLIVELRSRIAIAGDLVRAGKTVQEDIFWLAGVWHAIFIEIATMQMTAFGDQTTRGTFYEPKDPWRVVLPYLYPAAATKPAEPGQSPQVVEYWDVGIAPAPGRRFAFTDSKGTAHTRAFSAFSLYDVTRRALNSLLLLHMKPDPKHALLSPSLDVYRGALLKTLNAATDSDAINTVSDHCAQLLNAWDSFLRENYYSGGQIPNDITEKRAYEAGSALARLTWELNAQATKATEAPQQKGDAGHASVEEVSQTAAGGADPASAGKIQCLYEIWDKAFDSRPIEFIQHQLLALGTALDDAFYRASGKPKPQSQPGADTPFDPDLPSATLLCVSRSLDFWRDTVTWLNPHAKHSVAMTASLETELRNALIEQANVWQALITEHQSLDGFAVTTVMDAIVQEVISSFEETMKEDVQEDLGAAFWDNLRRVALVLLVVLGAVLCLSIPGAIWLIAARPAIAGGINPNGLWGVLGIGPVLAAIVGYRATTQATQSGTAATSVAVTSAGAKAPSAGSDSAAATSTHSSVADFLGNMMSTVDAALVTMLNAAQKQIRIDLAVLNHQIGLSYPLIETIVKSTGDVKDDYAFMTQVIWSNTDRKNEALSVVRAALGPIGLLISTHAAALKASDSGGPGVAADGSAGRTASRAAAAEPPHAVAAGKHVGDGA